MHPFSQSRKFNGSKADIVSKNQAPQRSMRNQQKICSIVHLKEVGVGRCPEDFLKRTRRLRGSLTLCLSSSLEIPMNV